MENSDYEFTNNWFSPLIESVWNMIIPMNTPIRFLEIGSFEGRSTCWLINKFAKMRDIEIHCVDTWKGCNDNELMNVDFRLVRYRFNRNTDKAIRENPYRTKIIVYECESDKALADMLFPLRDKFDFIYVDAGHKASECLSDAVMAWKLLREGGVMCFDDYIFAVRQRPRWDVPKTAIDAFINIHVDDCELINAPNQQVFIRKVKRKYEHSEI